MNLQEIIEVDKVYIHGLTHRITRDQLVLSLEDLMKCDVDEVIYGVDPTIAMVTFSEAIGKISSQQ